jgi:hypothetical protein
VRFQCPHCHQIVDIDDGECGQPVGCGNCGNITVVPASRFAPGAVINDFIVKDILGRGGMGMVYLAHQMTLDRPVALKILMDEFANNSAFIVDFVKEARAAARLNHPNIVQSYAVGEEDGIYYFAMEYVEGKTLKQEMESQKNLPVERVLNIILQITEALDFAWKQQQLVHRDIKPDNIMLTPRGVAKLADLGLARVANELLHDDDDEVMGTPQYICPEQLLGQPMDVRGDIYSLGATFFHAVTGEFPFDGNTAAEIARKHLQEQLRRPSTVRPAVPDTVSFIIEKMMKKRLEERYEDASELAHDLGRVLRNEEPLGYDAAARGYVAPAAAGSKSASAVAKSTGIRTKLKTKAKFKTGTSLGTKVPASVAPAPASVDPVADEEEAEEAAPSTTEEDAVEELAPAAVPAPEIGGRGSKKIKFGAKKRGGPPSTMSLAAAEVSARSPTVINGAKGANAPPSTMVRRQSKMKLLIVAIALLFVGIVSAGIYVFLEVQKYDFKTTEAVKAFYLKQVTAEERDSYARLHELLDKRVTGEQEMAHLNNLVTQLSNFAQKQPKSLFCLPAAQIASLPALQLPGVAAKLRQAKIIALASPLAGEIPALLEERQEALLRKLRQQAHQDEQDQVVAVNRRLLKAKGMLEETLVHFREFLATRKRTLEGDLRRYQATNKRRLDLFEKEKDSVRQQVFNATFDYQFYDARSKLDELARARGDYPPSVESQIDIVLKDREEDKALEELVAQLGGNKDLDLTASDLRQTLKAEVQQVGLSDLYKQFDQVKKDEAGFPPIRDAFFDRQKNMLQWAIQFNELVANTQQEFHGQRISRPPFEVTPGQVVEINLILSSDIMLDIKQFDTTLSQLKTIETRKLPIRQMDLKLITDLARRKWGDVNQAEFELYKTAYLLYTGKIPRLQDAINTLTDGRAAWLSEELKLVEPVWRTFAMEETVQRVKAMLEAKNPDTAKRYFESVKRAIGDTPEFKKREQELLGLLGN